MLDFSRVQNYYIACGYTDMRKQIDSLAALVQRLFQLRARKQLRTPLELSGKTGEIEHRFR